MRTLYKNARIYTMDPKQLWAEEMMIEDDRIVSIGMVGNISEKADRVVDCQGRMMMPSFIDSHCHPGFVSESMWHVKLPLFDTAEELLTYIKSYASEHPKDEMPFLCFDYYKTELFDENGPKKEMLDQAVSDRPCIVTDFTEHMNWLNSMTLDLMEVDKDTPDVDELHVFWRDSEGNPTGWVKERAHAPYLDRVYDKIGWHPPDALGTEGMKVVMDQMTRWGYAGMFVGFLEAEKEIQSIHELDIRGNLPFYYDASIRCDSLSELPEKIAYLKELQRKYTTKHIKLNTIKLFLDGTVASGNAGMLDPLCNDPSGTNCGVTALEYDELVEYFRICNTEDMDVHIHIVGDRSFRMICDAVEELRKVRDDWHIQVVIAHACLVNKADRKRPRELGISINITPHWNAGMYGEASMPVIGKKRWLQQSCFMEMIRSGAQVAFSTDTTSMFEFNRSNPFWGIQCGLTRVDIEYPLDPEKYPGSVMPPENEKIPLGCALKGFTLEGARQMRIADITGSLEVGKKANFIILSDNCFKVSPFEIKNIEVICSVFEGKVTYRKTIAML